MMDPNADVGGLELADLLDVPALQRLMDDFYAVARFPMSIVDLKGSILVGVGWQDMCTRFHRVHPETCKLCTESDLQLSAGVPQGEFRLYKCKNGLWDIATPLVVGGQKVGNIFSGQFFFDDELIDREGFRAQARQYGFDELDYLAALDRVPRFSRVSVERGMSFLLKLADMLSRLGFSNARLSRLLADQDRLTATLHQEQDSLKRAQEIANLGSWELDLATNKITWSDEVYRIFGLEPHQFAATYTAFLEYVHPDDRATVDSAYTGSLREGREAYDLEHRVVRHTTGEIRFVHERCQHVRDSSGTVVRSVGMVHDITDRKKAEAELRRSNERFALLSETAGSLLASPSPRVVVDELCRKVLAHLRLEVFVNYLVEGTPPRLHLNACAGVPADTARILEWLNFGVAVCGRVARDGRRIIVEDIQHVPDERASIVKSIGVQAYCCHPLLCGTQVIGTLSFGSRQRPRFTDDEVELMRVVADQVSVAMERLRTENTLRELNAQLEQRVLERTAALERTTEALKAERQRFMDVLDRLPAYVVLLTPDYEVPFANRYFEESFGKSHGRRCYEYLFNRTQPCEVCETMRPLREGTPVNWEWTGPNGRRYDVSDFPFTDTDGSTMVLEMGIDVTERKQAEAELEKHRHHLEDLVGERTRQLSAANKQLQREIAERKEAQLALQQSEERFRLAIRHSKLMAWQCDAEMRFSWVYNSHFGTSDDELIGKTPADLGNEAGMAEFTAHGRALLDQQSGGHKTIRLVRVDGQEQYFDQQVEILRDATGSVVGLIGISLDVTERELAEQRLHKSEESFRLMIAHSAEPMLLVDERGRIECISSQGAERLGYHDSELQGTSVDRLLDWSAKLDLTMRLEDFRRHAPLPVSAVLRVRTGAGQWRWVDVHASFVNYGQRPEKYLLKFELIDTEKATR